MRTLSRGSRNLYSLSFLVLSLPLCLCGQGSNLQRWEAGAQITTARFEALAEKPFGLGGRVGYDFSRRFALEAEVNHFPENSQGNFGETEILSGAKVTQNLGPFSIFGTVRPGAIHFGGSIFQKLNPDFSDRFAFNLGAGVGVFPSMHTGFRLEFGDTMIFYQNAFINDGLRVYRPGVDHNLQITFGFFFRF